MRTWTELLSDYVYDNLAVFAPNILYYGNLLKVCCVRINDRNNKDTAKITDDRLTADLMKYFFSELL